jgi:proteasome lid subunit RPN8/RPN11
VTATPYPPIRRWVLPPSALVTTLEGVRQWGKKVRESGALWLGERATNARISSVVFLQGKGIDQLPDRWKVSAEVFGAVTRWAKPRGLCLLGVVHTHLRGIPPRLSRADREYSVQVPDMLAVVIGDGGAELDYRKWGWYVYEHDRYRRLTGQELIGRLIFNAEYPFEVCRADANGVSEST